MRFRSNIAVAGGLAAILIGQSMPTSNATEETYPIAAEGELPSASGINAANVFALGDDANVKVGDSISRTAIPATFSRLGTHYELKIDPKIVPAEAVDSGGVVNLELRFTNGESTWTTFVSSRIVRNLELDTVQWVDPLDALSDAPSASGPFGPVRAIPSLERRAAPHIGADQLGSSHSALVSDTFPIQLANPCDYQYVKDSDRSTTIATSYPYGASTSWLEVDRSEGGTFGVAFSGGGAFSVNGSDYVGGGWGATWSKSSELRSYRIGVNYHYYKAGCGSTSGFWSPHIETGSVTSNYSGLSRPDWKKYCGPMDKGATFVRYFSDYKSYSNSVGVKFKDVIGIDLSSKKEYSRSHKLSYTFGGEHRRLCGSDDYPSRAGKLVERLTWN